MNEQDFAPLEAWQEQNRKEAQWIRELQDKQADLERRIKSLEWLARGDVEELPEEEWWGDKFNKAVDIVRRLAAAQDLAALHGLHYEAIELMKNFPKNG